MCLNDNRRPAVLSESPVRVVKRTRIRWCCFLSGSCFHILSRKSEGWFFRARTRKWVAHFRCLFTTFFQWPVAALVCFMLIPTHKYHKFSLPSRPYCCKGSRWRWCKPFFSEKKRNKCITFSQEKFPSRCYCRRFFVYK